MPRQIAALPSPFPLVHEKQWLTIPSGVAGLELPRDAITEAVGPPSSGRTALLYSALAATTRRQGACAVVDPADVFDPASAAEAGVDLRFLLWIRCANNRRCALQVTDWLLQAGGFSMVALDLANFTSRDLRNIPLHTWFRFRRAVEHKPTSLVVIAREHCTGSAAALQIEMSQKTALWKGQLLRGAAIEATPRKPVRSEQATFEAESCLLA